MNKKFNESELEEIMNEIETLEKEFGGEGDDASHSNDILRKLTELTVEEATARHHNVHEFSKSSYSSHETSVSFKVAGQMSLNLNIEIGGKEVKICVDESEGLIIEMDEGMKFQIPVHSSHKKVA